MKKSWILIAIAVLAVVAGVGVSASSATAAKAGRLHAQKVCATPAAGKASCHAQVLVDAHGAYPLASSPPAGGFDPFELRDAYKLTGLSSAGRTVAVVDAYGYPNLERDLGVYRSTFGIPACTKANGCLRIVNQSGGSLLPRMDTGWAQEQALDVDAVSAACPDCKILVVQASTPSFGNLGTAVNTAARLGAAAISNSYGGGDAADTSYGKYYNHPGIAVTASTGDSGYKGGSYPASSSYVTAVGGTSLAKDSSARGWSETVWSGAGSGCSSYNVALSAAAAFDTGCGKRAMADVSAAADPSTGGMAVYYPTGKTASTWGQFGGTSESAPIIAAVYALSGNTAAYPNALPYAHPEALFDVTSGNNGTTCPTTQWCTARVGWDGPTGLGTPNGIAGF